MNRTGSAQGPIAGVRHETGSIGIGGDATNRRGRESRENRLESDLFIFLSSDNLRATLRIVSGYCQLLTDRHAKNLDAESQQWLRNAVVGAEPLQSLVKELFAYSCIGCRGEARRRVSCGLILDGAVSRLGTEFRAFSASITRDLLPLVVIDMVEHTLVFRQLLDNAIKCVRERPPRVHVGAKIVCDVCIFHVRDNDGGIGPEELELVLTLLRRLDTLAAQPGNGIGHVICKRVLEQHSGTVWVNSQLGVGSTFHLSIPRTESRGSFSDASRVG